MGKGYWKILLIVILLVIAANIALLAKFFYRTGGAGLARIVWHYLIRDIPDKKYNWQDFLDRGPGTIINGFYSGADEEGFYLWTLSGREKFYHRPDISVYMFNDVCAAVRELNTNPNSTDRTWRKNQVTGDILEWQEWMELEYLIGVKRLEESERKNVVDKVWSVSGKYKAPDQLTLEQCD